MGSHMSDDSLSYIYYINTGKYVRNTRSKGMHLARDMVVCGTDRKAEVGRRNCDLVMGMVGGSRKRCVG